MGTTLPGTTLEVTKIEKGLSRSLFDGIFAAGGITLSQVSIMTGLEPYLIQNWVKRGFVPHPEGRVYSRGQFARIIIINMLKESLQMEKICTMIRVIAGNPSDSSDDLISDDELYHRYVDMLAENSINIMDEASVVAAANVAAECAVSEMSKRRQLADIFRAMLYAHMASEMRSLASGILSDL